MAYTTLTTEHAVPGLGRLRHCSQNLLATKLHHPVRIRTVGAHFGDQIDGRLKHTIGQIVIGIYDCLFEDEDDMFIDSDEM